MTSPSSNKKKSPGKKKSGTDPLPELDLIKSPNLFPVVGIGASAGGLNAFKTLLKAIPVDSGMAYVLVQHLDPNHESLLPEILQKVTRIPVLEITDDIKVQPDHIYVIPSNKMMVATDGVLLLADRPPKNKTERNLPIDLFFKSLAEVHMDHAIGVVLSGTASDGTQGLKVIKENGGITFAQDEASAEYEGMPHSAAQAGVVDFILPPEEIPKKLLEVTRKTVLSDEELQNIPLHIDDSIRNISLEVIPLPNTLEPYYLLLFHDHNLNGSEAPAISKREKAAGKIKKDDKDKRIQLLEQELSQAREDMRSITEDQEASNEELQSANEELLSGSEELQSLNEELETSKEELQSTNEELTVLNHELISLNEQITDARNYSESIVATLYQPLLVLDKHLRVKTANKAFYKTFNVNEQETEGVLVYDLGNRQWNIPKLRTLLEEILPQKKQITDFEVTHNFTSIGERVILLSALELTREKKEEKLILLSIEDITEKALALKKIEESEKRYNMMVMQSPFAFAVLQGKDMVITLANDSIKEMWGKGKEIEGKPLLEVLPEIKDQAFPALLHKVFTTGIPFYANDDFAQLKRNGKMEDVYFNFVYQPYREADETISGVTIIATEVTPEVILNKKIKESEERFQSAVGAVEGIVWTNNAKGEMEGTQPGWALLTGQTYEEYQGYGWAKAIHPDDERPTVEAWNKAVRERKNFVFEHRIRLKNGDWGEFLAKAIPLLDANGSVREWVGVHTDIHEQKRAIEEQQKITEHFHFIADAMPQKVWTADAAGNYDYLNKCWLDYTGLSFEELKDLGWKKVIHPDDWEETITRWKESIHTGENFEMEHRFVNTQGIYKWHLTRGLAQKDQYGTIQMWIGTNTEMQHIKEEEQRKGDFIKMVSHEIKTPVTSIKGYVQLLLIMLKEKEATPSSFLETPLVRIDSQVKRLSRLISEMLDLSRLDSGKLDLQEEFFNLDALVLETVQDMLYTNTNYKINVVQEFTGTVFGDKDRLGQVIINLIDNAIKYSPENKMVEIRLYRMGNTQVAVSVKDYGIGIDKEHQQKIFERFYRAGGLSEQNFAGFGIGLFIAKEIIERHNGLITVESEKDKGSTFTFILPLAT